MTDTEVLDIFISYARDDLRSGQPERRRSLPSLVAALREMGLRIFFDTDTLDDFAVLNPAFDAAIRRSKAVLAWYSPRYPTRPACRAELSLALIAARMAPTGHNSVLLAINTESDVAHISHAQVLGRNVLASPAEGDRQAVAELARKIAAQVCDRADPIGRPEGPPPAWHPSPVAGASRFMGRLRELWTLDAQVWPELCAPSDRALPRSFTNPVSVSGLGGTGKTLLVLEYARMMAPAFPGGIFWLPAGGGDEETTAQQLEARRESAFRSIATSLRIDVEKLDLPSVVSKVAGKIADKQSCLWIVDDLPAGLEQTIVERWLGPAPTARTVITTRSQEYAFLANVPLAAMDDAEALAMLTVDNQPDGPAEHEAAEAIVHDVEGHPMALDLTRAFLAQRRSYQAFLARLRAPAADTDVLEEVHVRAGQRSLELVMLASFSLLDGNGLTALRLACSMPALPVPESLMRAVASRTAGDTDQNAEKGVDDGIVSLLHLSLARRIEPGVIQLHALVNRSGRRLEADAVAKLRPRVARSLFDALDGIKLEDLKLRDVPHEVRLAREFAGTLDSPVELWVNRVALLAESKRGAYQTSLPAWKEQVAAADRVLGVASWEAVLCRCCLSYVLRELTQFKESLSVAEEALYWSERNHGWTDVHTIHAAECVALALASLRRRQEAIAAFERVRAAYAALGPAGTAGVKRIMSNLSVLGSSEGLGQLLDDAVADAGADEEALRTVVQLAPLEVRAGRPAVAIRHLTSCLSRLRKLVDDRNPLVCNCMVHLAQAHAALEEYATAEELLRSALGWYEIELGHEHPTTVDVRQQLVAVRDRHGDPEIRAALGQAFSAQEEAARKVEAGDLPAALAKAESALASLRALLGPTEPHAISALRQVAHIAASIDLSRCTGALDELCRLQPADDQRRREDLENLVLAAGNAALTARSRKDSAGASHWAKRILEAQDELHGSRSDQAVIAAWNLNELLVEDGRSKDAMDVFIDRVVHLLARDEASLGSDLQSIREAAGLKARDCRTRSGARYNDARLSEEETAQLATRANAASGAGEPWQAQSELQRLADEYALRFGSFHPKTLHVNWMLWSAVGHESARLGDSKTLELAIEQLSLVGRAQRAQLGDDHPAVLNTLANHASCVSQVRPAEAARMDEECLELARRIHGLEGKTTVLLAFNAIDSASRTSNHTGARALFIGYLGWLVEREPGTLPEELRGDQERAIDLGRRLHLLRNAEEAHAAVDPR